MNWRKMVDYLTSHQFKESFFTLLACIVVLAIITACYISVFESYLEPVSGSRIMISSINIEKQDIVDSRPYIVISWYTSKPSISSYEVLTSSNRLVYSDSRFKTHHREAFLMSEQDFMRNHQILITARTQKGEFARYQYNFTVRSPIAEPKISFT